MRILANLSSRVKAPLSPLSSVSEAFMFPDKLQIWFQSKEGAKRIKRIRMTSGGKLKVDNRPMRFNKKYNQRFQINRPSLRALPYCSHGMLNFVEEALELICHDNVHRQDLFEYVTKRIVKYRGKEIPRWVSKRQGKEKPERFDTYKEAIDVDIPKDQVTFYTGQRWDDPLVFRIYQGTSKVNQKPCIRIEVMISHAHNVQRHIGGVVDLVSLNRNEFWKKLLKLIDNVDIEALGRRKRNQQNNTRRQSSEVWKGINLDLNAGNLMTRIGGGTCQGLIRRFGFTALRGQDNIVTNAYTIVADAPTVVENHGFMIQLRYPRVRLKGPRVRLKTSKEIEVKQG